MILALILGLLLIVYFLAFYKPKIAEIAQNPKTDPMFAELIKKDNKDAVEKPAEQASATNEQVKVNKSEPLTIKSIQFLPENPTISDNIKVEAKANYEARGITFEYKWMINQKVIDDIKGDILPAGKFKKYDHISVIITPYMKGTKSYYFVSGAVVIQNSVPSLDMKVVSQKQKIDEPIEMQLTGSDPDGDKVTFSLEAPVLEGMTINKETGKIVWKPQKQQKGIYLFGASAADPDGAKMTKTFELKID